MTAVKSHVLFIMTHTNACVSVCVRGGLVNTHTHTHTGIRHTKRTQQPQPLGVECAFGNHRSLIAQCFRVSFIVWVSWTPVVFAKPTVHSTIHKYLRRQAKNISRRTDGPPTRPPPEARLKLRLTSVLLGTMTNTFLFIRISTLGRLFMNVC